MKQLLLFVLIISMLHVAQALEGRRSQPTKQQHNHRQQQQQQQQQLRRLGYRNDDGYANYPSLEICEDLIVQVTSIKTVCDSPQTFYYGSGVNRNSRTCNYGDKATITVYFDVTEDLYNTNIYVVMSVYAGYGNEILTSTSPKNLKKYVGYSCNEAGSYSYTYSTTIGSASSSSGGSFVPYVQIAFSSETNGDYNLGAANIPCKWNDSEFGQWTEVQQKSSQFTTRDFLAEYGILMTTVAFCFLFVIIFTQLTIYRSRLIEARHNNSNLDDKANALMAPPDDATTS